MGNWAEELRETIEKETEDKTVRQVVLEEAMKVVLTNREQQYGPPEDSFTAIKRLWTAYKGVPFSLKDVAIMMSLMKVGRIMTGQIKEDNWIDAIGYMACGAEMEVIESGSSRVTEK